MRPSFVLRTHTVLWKLCIPDPILKSRDITVPTKVHLVKAMVLPVVMYGCDSWTVKKAERQRIDAFELWCWRRLLRVPWTAKRSNQSILKEISAGSRRETFHSWQRSWGRRLGIRKGRIEPQECPQIFSSTYPPKTRVCLLYWFVLSPLTLLGAVSHHHLALSVKELTYSSN